MPSSHSTSASEMQCAVCWVAFAVIVIALGYLSGSAVAFSLCHHEVCRFYLTFMGVAFFATMGTFLVACLAVPHHAPEFCQACCNVTADCASDVACCLVVDHFVE